MQLEYWLDQRLMFRPSYQPTGVERAGVGRMMVKYSITGYAPQYEAICGSKLTVNALVRCRVIRDCGFRSKND